MPLESHLVSRLEVGLGTSMTPTAAAIAAHSSQMPPSREAKRNAAFIQPSAGLEARANGSRPETRMAFIF
jgi:hypothetical protein